MSKKWKEENEMKKKFVALGICALLIGAAVIWYVAVENPFQLTEEQEDQQENPPESLGNNTVFSDAVNAFSFQLFQQMLSDTRFEENQFISPYSIFTALAMTYEGAHNSTAEELRHVLSIEQDNASFHEYMQSLYQYLNENDNCTVSTANALWVEQTYHILSSYKDLIETFYGATSTETDFSNPETAAELINGWIENHTNQIIKDLISPDTIDPAFTKLILTNAIYFKGAWHVPFNENYTSSRAFDTASDGQTMVDTMEGRHQFLYYEDQQKQALELLYEGSKLSMTILLPKTGVTIQDIMASLTYEEYRTVLSTLNATQVDVYLPRFTIETPVYHLGQTLSDLGMPTAFTGAADFSGVSGTKELFISDVVHKAFIEVNEEGTEAAAATGIIMNIVAYPGDEPPQQIIFDADHPFIFLIQHKPTGIIVFMGAVTNPTG